MHVLDITMCVHGNAAVTNGGMLFPAQFHSPSWPCINWNGFSEKPQK